MVKKSCFFPLKRRKALEFQGLLHFIAYLKFHTLAHTKIRESTLKTKLIEKMHFLILPFIF